MRAGPPPPPIRAGAAPPALIGGTGAGPDGAHRDWSGVGSARPTRSVRGRTSGSRRPSPMGAAEVAGAARRRGAGAE